MGGIRCYGVATIQSVSGPHPARIRVIKGPHPVHIRPASGPHPARIRPGSAQLTLGHDNRGAYASTSTGSGMARPVRICSSPRRMAAAYISCTVPPTFKASSWTWPCSFRSGSKTRARTIESCAWGDGTTRAISATLQDAVPSTIKYSTARPQTPPAPSKEAQNQPHERPPRAHPDQASSTNKCPHQAKNPDPPHAAMDRRACMRYIHKRGADLSAVAKRGCQGYLPGTLPIRRVLPPRTPARSPNPRISRPGRPSKLPVSSFL
jgi:hypothetical protein